LAGHRRISTDLFLKHLERSVPRSKVEALLELDLDEYRGSRKGIKAYSRMWGWSPGKVRRILAEFEEARADLYNSPENEAKTANPRRTPGEPFTNPPANPQNRMDSAVYLTGPNPEANPSRTPGEPFANPYLELQDPKPEKRGKAPSRSPLARGVGVANSRARQMIAQVEAALAKAPTESQERRAERRARFETLGEMFLACSRVPDEAQLRAYFRSTADIPTGVLEAACDAAIAATDSTFHPDVKTISAKGLMLEAQARKRARGLAV